MKPICAQVDQASETLMLIRVVITSAASTAVAVPATTSSACAAGTTSSRPPSRISTKPPRLTTPACSSADTGVGASITWISQPWNGSSAHFSSADTTISTTAACTTIGTSPDDNDGCCSIASMRSVSNAIQHRPIAANRQTSAMRLAISFLCAAMRAAGREPWNSSSRCREALASIQHSASSSRSLAMATLPTPASVAISQQA